MKIFALTLLLVFVTGTGSCGQALAFRGNGESSQERIPAPDSFGKLAEKHISTMYSRGYFRHLNRLDLNHGHLVFPVGSPETFSSLEDVLAHVALVLYHTDEDDFVWLSSEPVDPGKRKQRSIVGLPDGRIRPAIELFSVRYQDFDHYVCCGTIHVTDFGWFMPKQFEQDRDIRIVSQAGARWLINQFTIYKTASGRYKVAGIRYDIYFEFF